MLTLCIPIDPKPTKVPEVNLEREAILFYLPPIQVGTGAQAIHKTDKTVSRHTAKDGHEVDGTSGQLAIHELEQRYAAPARSSSPSNNRKFGICNKREKVSTDTITEPRIFRLPSELEIDGVEHIGNKSERTETKEQKFVASAVSNNTTVSEFD